MDDSYWGEGENKYRTQCKDVIKCLDDSLKHVFAKTGMPASYGQLKEVRNEEQAKGALYDFAKEIKDTPAYMAAAEKEPIVLNWIVHEWAGIKIGPDQDKGNDAAVPQYKSSEEAFFTSLKEIAKDEEIFQKLTPFSKTIIGDILKEYEDKTSDKWREMLSQKIDGVVRDMQENIKPESLGQASQERLGWFTDVTSQDAHALSRGKAIDDLLERARDLGLQMPKSRIEEMNTALNEGKVSVKVMQEIIDRTVEKHNQKGLAFWENRDRKENQPLLKYMDKNDKTHAFIAERTNSSTHEKFFAANIVENGKQVQLGTNKNLEALQNRVRAYYVGITMNEIKQAINRGVEEKKPEPAKQKEKGLDL